MIGAARSRTLGRLREIVGALGNAQRGDRTALTLIAGYALLWWIYAIIAKSSQDIHFDMGEVVSWSLVPAYGYPKHPPFPAWVASVWFAVFPYADWAFYLLSVTSIGVALWFVWRIAARFIEGDKRALALTMLTFSPGFNFQPIKFNSNALLIPVWAGASHFFLRSFTERTIAMGAAAGLCAAIAMLTKYWSFFLILGFIVAALLHPDRWRYLRSPAPYVSALVGGLVFAPNLVSLVDYQFQPFHYATAAHAADGFGQIFVSVEDYLGGVLFLAGGVAAIALASRPDAAAIRDMLLPREPDRRLMAVVTVTAFVAPILAALALQTRLAALWTMPLWAMLPAALLSSQRLHVSRDAAARVLAAAVAVPLVAVLLSPAVAFVIHQEGVPNHAAHYRLIAGAVENAWRERTAAPLRLFGSDTNIVNGAGFYLEGKPLRIDIVGPHDTPWADEARLARDGIALACASQDPFCMQALASYAGPAMPRDEVTLSRSYLGQPGEPARYTIVIVPPR